MTIVATVIALTFGALAGTKAAEITSKATNKVAKRFDKKKI